MRFIAFYLPQFHPIPENDNWWGKGFTEWVNVAKARPCFKGHYQPHIPADLGFYDLRLPIIREQQAELAREAGIEGFCYWHYWFGNGKRLLERPFNEVVESGSPDFPFCLCWANHTWTSKTWLNKNGFATDPILMQQDYLGEEDYTQHFYALLPAFKDKRYMKVDCCPIFVIYNPVDFKDVENFMKLWRKLAVENGLKGFHFVGRTNNASFRKPGEQGVGKFVLPQTDNAGDFYNDVLNKGFDAVNSVGRLRAELLASGKTRQIVARTLKRYLAIDMKNTYCQKRINDYIFAPEDKWDNVYPTVFPNWDRSPRGGKSATVYTDSTPQCFADVISKSVELSKDKQPEHQIIFIQAWNEWGEGNHMEPDLKYGKGYIEEMRKTVDKVL